MILLKKKKLFMICVCLFSFKYFEKKVDYYASWENEKYVKHQIGNTHFIVTVS
jgi:hypothetical protein